MFNGVDMSKKIKALKEKMILIYGLNCWINELWLPSKKDIITYHHILEVRNGGRDTLDNGALLAWSSHCYLNYLDREEHKIYQELNSLFQELNKTFAPPTKDYYSEVEHTINKSNLVRKRK